jgi:hypothetical protein
MVIPLLSLGGSKGSDKRVTEILKNYWDFLRENRSFPPEKEVQPKAIEKIWDNCFIVEANNLSRKEDYKYKYIGPKIITAYGQDLTGLTVENMASPEAGHLAEEYEKVLAIKRPVFDEGEFKTQDKKLIKYRQILLPLGENGISITAILGGMSSKVFDK